MFSCKAPKNICRHCLHFSFKWTVFIIVLHLKFNYRANIASPIYNTVGFLFVIFSYAKSRDTSLTDRRHHWSDDQTDVGKPGAETHATFNKVLFNYSRFLN